MSTIHKISHKYKKEYEDAVVTLGVIQKRIAMRFHTLCKRYPNVELYRINDKGLNDKAVLSGDFASAYKRTARLDAEAMIRFMNIIESNN
jgi:hypothetical protein